VYHSLFSDNIKLLALPAMTDADKTFAGILAVISGHGLPVKKGLVI